MQSLLTPKSNSSELTKEVLLTQVFSYSDCTNFLLSPQEIDVTPKNNQNENKYIYFAFLLPSFCIWANRLFKMWLSESKT